jgi:predicted nucleotidyltransferase
MGHTRSHTEYGVEVMDQLLRDRREEILKVAAGHGAADVRLFGSRARGEAGAASDVDLLVRLAPDRTLLDLVAIKQDLEDLLGCSVDVVTEEAISPFIRFQVLKEVVTL